MKSQHTLIISLFIGAVILLGSTTAMASHAEGGEISYTHLNGNNYLIHLVFYRDCFGIPAPASITVTISSVQCGLSNQLVLTPIAGTGQEITQPCGQFQSTCNGGTQPGIQKWEYESNYAFPAQCPDWSITGAISARNAAITTVQNPGSADLYIEAKLNNQTSDNNSPVFGNAPFIFASIGEDLFFNNGVTDADGDSLVYALIPARMSNNTPLSYNPGYSPLQPLLSSPQISIDAVTGDFFIHPTAQEVGIIVFEVQEFRNGNIIGSVMRDIQIYTTTTVNYQPFIYGVNGTGQSSIYVLPDKHFSFNIFSSDPDSTDSLSISWNNGIPAATFSTIGFLHQTGIFSWTPQMSDVRPQSYDFTVSVKDNGCPENKTAIYSYSIFVTLDSSLVTTLNTAKYYSGHVFYDINGNGIQDSIEINLPSQRIDVQPDGMTTFTDINGNYIFFSLLNTTHQFTVIPKPGYMITTDSLSYTVSDDSLYQSSFDFGLNAISSFTDMEVTLFEGISRCNSISDYTIHYENTGTTLLNGRIIFVLDDSTSLFYSIPSPDLIIGDSLCFNFTNLWPFTSRQIHLELMMPGPGTVLHFATYAEFDSSGTYYLADGSESTQTVICSYDPNDKSVVPEGLFGEHRTLYTDTFLYTIRFQNTGNDTAFTVYVRDLIDPAFDLSTFHVTGSSHPMTTTLFPNRMAEFKFENILLPDSIVDEPASHGYVQFSMRPRSNLPLPKLVSNEANIYFDSNAPVLTNTVYNTLVSDLYVGISQVENSSELATVIPNPFKGEAQIRLGESFKGSRSQLRVMNAMGELLFTKETSNLSFKISSEKLATGIYFYEVRNNNDKRAFGKFMIE